jgi:protein TonB
VIRRLGEFVVPVATMLVAGCAHDPNAPPETYCKPEYPAAALRAGAQGVTTVAFHLDANGKVTGSEIVKSAGPTNYHQMLDDETVRALSLCPFKAARDADGHPIASVVKVDYAWRIVN